MKVKLTKIDALSSSSVQEDILLETGKHVIGRVDFKCEDKRVPREHMEIDVLSCGSATITALHSNPVFYWSSDSGFETTIPLIKGESRALNEGDQISLLPESLRFKIKYIPDVDLKNMDQNKEVSTAIDLKDKTLPKNKDVDHKCNDQNGNTPSDIPPTSAAHETCPADTSDDSVLIIEQDLGPPCVIDDDSATEEMDRKDLDAASNARTSDDHQTVAIKREAEDEGPSAKRRRSATSPTHPQEDIKPEPVDVDVKAVKMEAPKEEEEAGGSGSADPVAPPAPPVRPCCMYAATCYRRNPIHRMDFCHPGDADWRTPPDCSYGAACYRRSQTHRAKYNHVGPPAPRPPDLAGAGELMRVERHGNVFYVRAQAVNFYDDHFEAVDSEGDSADHDYEF